MSITWDPASSMLGKCVNKEGTIVIEPGVDDDAGVKSDPEPLLRATLRTFNGEYIPLRLGTGEEQLLVGRDARRCDLIVEDAQVSRIHCAISAKSSVSAMVEDRGSSNGTFINGRRVRGSAPLASGDAIKFGRTTLVFEIE